MPAAEVILWEFIRRKQLGVSFRRQHPIKPYIVDFACISKKLIIELDGDSHIGNEDYDEARTKFLESKGWRVLRFWNHEIYEQLDEVIEQITNNIKGGK